MSRRRTGSASTCTRGRAVSAFQLAASTSASVRARESAGPASRMRKPVMSEILAEPKPERLLGPLQWGSARRGGVGAIGAGGSPPVEVPPGSGSALDDDRDDHRTPAVLGVDPAADGAPHDLG